MKKVLLTAALVIFASTGVSAQEPEVEKLTKNTELLRQLYSEGLIARIEVDKAEQELVAAKARVAEEARLADLKAEELKKAEEAAKVKTFVKPTLMPLNKTATVLRSTAGSWSIAGLSSVQQFFSKTFGKPLPTSTIGQSATHNRMRWNHTNAVDVGLHPDSTEGRALMAYLQSQGIPFLAFRGAIPGVSTGPHIHIGSPSHRL
ncbi:MAG TPA: hypothetical protein VFB65_02175 [Pyrinomonadaceae bacterium]|nr:hypothetical protein [Pyrinomonadaceae bacterium]